MWAVFVPILVSISSCKIGFDSEAGLDIEVEGDWRVQPRLRFLMKGFAMRPGLWRRLGVVTPVSVMMSSQDRHSITPLLDLEELSMD